MKKTEAVLTSKKKLTFAYIVMTLFTLPIALMYLWLIINAFTKNSSGAIPTEFTLANWKFLFGTMKIAGREIPPIWGALSNSLIFALGIMILEVTISSLAGYTLSRMTFPGRQLIMRSIILLHAFPGVSLLIAVFYVLTSIGLVDTLIGVILVKTALQIPMSTYIIKGFFDEVPWDVEWSAMVDGCSRPKALVQVVLPHVKPGIASISIFSFLAGWSEFILLYTFIFDSKKLLLATYLTKIMGEDGVLSYGILSAVGLFYMIPVLIFFLLSQKSLMQMNMGGGKGV